MTKELSLETVKGMEQDEGRAALITVENRLKASLAAQDKSTFEIGRDLDYAKRSGLPVWALEQDERDWSKVTNAYSWWYEARLGINAVEATRATNAYEMGNLMHGEGLIDEPSDIKPAHADELAREFRSHRSVRKAAGRTDAQADADAKKRTAKVYRAAKADATDEGHALRTKDIKSARGPAITKALTVGQGIHKVTLALDSVENAIEAIRPIRKGVAAQIVTERIDTITDMLAALSLEATNVQASDDDDEESTDEVSVG